MKKRVLVIGITEKLGGIENFYMNYYRKIDKNKYQIDFLTNSENMIYKDEVINNGGKIFVAPSLRKHPIKHYKSVYNLFKNNKFDIVHANMPNTFNLFKLKSAKKYGVKKIIVHSHNGNFGDLLGLLKNRLSNKKLKKYGTDFLACSTRAGRWMFGEKIKFKLLNNAIELDKFKFNDESRNEMRKQLNLENCFVIGHVGRFHKHKNHKFLIEFFNEFAKTKQNARLLLIGSGEKEKNIRKLIKKLQLDSKVTIIYTNESYKYYNAFDVFVLPSLTEGLPLVGVEAQANGLPCLFSDRVTKEMELNKNVRFLSIKNEEDWANALSLVEHNRVEKIENNLQKYNIEKEVKELEKIYDEE